MRTIERNIPFLLQRLKTMLTAVKTALIQKLEARETTQL
jgi:hypothetical protein